MIMVCADIPYMEGKDDHEAHQCQERKQ